MPDCSSFNRQRARALRLHTPTIRAALFRCGGHPICVVTIDDKAGWSLGFAHEKWTLTTGRAFPIVLTFDGQTPFNVHGVPIADKLLQVPMPDNSSLISQFRKAKAMTAYAQGQLFQFKLDQTAQLLPTLANCVAKVKQFGIAAAGDFSVALAAPKPVAPLRPQRRAGLKKPALKPVRVFW